MCSCVGVVCGCVFGVFCVGGCVCSAGFGFISGNSSYTHFGVASGICASYFITAMSLLVLKNATCAARSITSASFIRLTISFRSSYLKL